MQHLRDNECNTPFTRYNLLSKKTGLTTGSTSRLSNGFDNRLNVCIHDTAGCQTGLSTGCIV